MSKAKQQRRKQIKTEMALGQRRFILLHGILGWGIPTYFLYLGISVLFQTLFQGSSFVEALRLMFPFTFIFGLVVFVIAGVFMGRYRWKQLVKEVSGKQRKAKAEKKK